MVTSLVLGLVWLAAAVAAAGATWHLMSRARGSTFEAMVAAIAVALVVPPLAAAWFLLLPLRFSVSFTLGCLVVAAPAAWVLTRGPLSTPRRWHLPSKRALAGAAAPALVIVGAGAVSAYAAWIKPVWEIDALLYHGPAVANLVEHGSLFGWDSPSPWIFYPNLAAILSAAVAVTGRTVALLDATQAPFLVLLGLVIWAWAAQGRARPLIGAVSAIAVLTPAAFVQGRAMYVDVIYAAVLLTGLWLVGMWLTRRSRTFLVLGMVFIGAAPAVKPSGVTIAGAILLVALGVLVIRRRRGALLAGGLSIGAFIAAAAPFYLRNAIEFSNPLYPVSSEIFGHRLPGPVDVTVMTANAAPLELANLPGPLGFFRNLVYGVTSLPNPLIYDSRIGAFGPITAILAAILGVGIVAVLATARRRDFHRLKRFAWPILAGALVLLLQLQAWNPRYTLAVFAIIVVIAGMAVDLVSLPKSTDVMLSVATCLVLLGPTAMAENATMQSIASSRGAQEGSQLSSFNGGVTGTNPAYQDWYRWLSGAPCGTRVVVASLPMQAGLLNAYNLPMWGDGLCNEVIVARDVRRGGGDYMGGDRRNLEALIPSADYVVAFEADRGLVADVARRNGLRARVVSDPPDYFGADQVVFRIERSP
jgi:hypothetical protein